jgi:hypothetical protein
VPHPGPVQSVPFACNTARVVTISLHLKSKVQKGKSCTSLPYMSFLEWCVINSAQGSLIFAFRWAHCEDRMWVGLSGASVKELVVLNSSVLLLGYLNSTWYIHCFSRHNAAHRIRLLSCMWHRVVGNSPPFLGNMSSPIVSLFTPRVAYQDTAFFVNAARTSPQLEVACVGLETGDEVCSLVQRANCRRWDRWRHVHKSIHRIGVVSTKPIRNNFISSSLPISFPHDHGYLTSLSSSYVSIR